MAMVNAGDTSPRTVWKSTFGAVGVGMARPLASSGNLLPMVANSIPANLLRSTEAAVPITRAISDPGIFLLNLPQRMMTPSAARLAMASGQFISAKWDR